MIESLSFLTFRLVFPYHNPRVDNRLPLTDYFFNVNHFFLVQEWSPQDQGHDESYLVHAYQVHVLQMKVPSYCDSV